jgi:hypothetical protein
MCAQRTTRCPQGGYCMDGYGSFGTTDLEWVCSCPTHPHHPGPCPNCEDRGHHRHAGLGMKELRRAACGMEFLPSVPHSAP